MHTAKIAALAVAGLAATAPATAATPSETSTPSHHLSRVWGCPDTSILLIDGEIGLGDDAYWILDGPPYHLGTIVTVCNKTRCGKARILGCVPLA